MKIGFGISSIRSSISHLETRPRKVNFEFWDRFLIKINFLYAFTRNTRSKKEEIFIYKW